MASQRVRVRTAGAADADAVADLSTQLGYPTTGPEVAGRLRLLLSSPEQAVLVAEDSDGAVVGWLHACVHHFIGGEPYAEIAGLVVHERHRGGGIGRLLMTEAERWAARRGLKTVNVRSRVERALAHRFYEDLGYGCVKQQQVFRKTLQD